MHTDLDSLTTELKKTCSADPSDPTNYTKLVNQVRAQMEQRRAIFQGLNPKDKLSKLEPGVERISAVIDLVSVASETKMKTFSSEPSSADRYVDLWGRAEASRALLFELINLWPGEPPIERINVLSRSANSLASDMVKLAFETHSPTHDLIDIFIELGVG